MSQIRQFLVSQADDAEVTSLRRRFEALSSHLSSVGKLETVRASPLEKNLTQLQVLAPVSAACRTRPLSSFKDGDVNLKNPED